jgi:hypothetical protein
MNQYYLTYSSEGVKLIEGEKMPPALYHKVLQEVLQASIPVQNKEYAIALIAKHGSPEIPHLSLKHGPIYGPFNGGYEIRDERIEVMSTDGASTDMMVGYRKVAILSEPEEKDLVKDSQEKVFDELFCRYFDLTLGQNKSGHTAVQELMQHFTITRK